MEEKPRRKSNQIDNKISEIIQRRNAEYMYYKTSIDRQRLQSAHLLNIDINQNELVSYSCSSTFEKFLNCTLSLRDPVTFVLSTFFLNRFWISISSFPKIEICLFPKVFCKEMRKNVVARALI